VPAGTEASPSPAIPEAPPPPAVDAGALDVGDVSAGADPVAGIVIAAKQLAATGKLARALDIVIAGRALYRDRAELPLLAGKLYFSKYWWTDGIASFREAIKLDPSVRSDPELVEAAVNGFMTTPDWDGRLAGFLLELGPGALEMLEALAQSHRVPALRTRAAALAKRWQTTHR